MAQHLLDTLRADFTELRSEQRERMSRRDNQVYVGLGVTGAAAALLLTNPTALAASAVALSLPLGLFALGFLAVSDDKRVSEIDDCVKQSLAPAIEECVALLYPGLTPEQRLAIFPWYRGWRKRYGGRWLRKRLRLLLMLIVFSAPALLGPLLFLMVAPLSLLSGVAVFDLILTSLLTTEIILSAEVISLKR